MRSPVTYRTPLNGGGGGGGGGHSLPAVSSCGFPFAGTRCRADRGWPLVSGSSVTSPRRLRRPPPSPLYPVALAGTASLSSCEEPRRRLIAADTYRCVLLPPPTPSPDVHRNPVWGLAARFLGGGVITSGQIFSLSLSVNYSLCCTYPPTPSDPSLPFVPSCSFFLISFGQR